MRHAEVESLERQLARDRYKANCAATGWPAYDPATGRRLPDESLAVRTEKQAYVEREHGA